MPRDLGGIRGSDLRCWCGCSVTEAEVTGLLEPSVGVKEPVRRLHAVVGDNQHRRLLAPKPFRLLDQTPTGSIDRLVDLYQLVSGLVWSVGGVTRVETVPSEVAGNVGTHEVDTEKPKLGLQLEYEQADVCDLLDVVRERRGCSLEVAQIGRVARRATSATSTRPR